MNQLIPAKKDGENSDRLRIKTDITGGLAGQRICSPFFVYPAAFRAAASRNTSTAESLIVIHKLKE